MKFSNLPDIEFVDADPGKIKTEIIITHEAITGKSLSPADPERLFIEALGTIIAQQRALINHTGKQNLLRYAANEKLDAIGEFSETDRLQESHAACICRFSIASPLGFAVGIGQGTRVSPNGTVFFATNAYTEITSGETYVDVAVTCLNAGILGNGYIPGQVNQLVDPIAYINQVDNITTTAGGSEEEDDESYRYRIKKAPGKYSVAGSTEAYIYWAISAHQDIADVTATSPSAGGVLVTVLMKDGLLPDAALLQSVDEIVSSKKRRPLTDNVTVSGPEIVPFDIDLDYFIDAADIATIPQIQASVLLATNRFKQWQVEKLGRDINPDELIYQLKSAGAKRVIIRAPTYAPVDETQVGQCGAATVNYQGVENG